MYLRTYSIISKQSLVTVVGVYQFILNCHFINFQIMIMMLVNKVYTLQVSCVVFTHAYVAMYVHQYIVSKASLVSLNHFGADVCVCPYPRGYE